MDSLSIIICTERGPLEQMSRLLVSSLRTFGGELKEVPIYSYSPRRDHRVGRETLRFFEKNEVEVIDVELNRDFRDYPLANKIVASEHAERKLNSDSLVFLDSDTFFLAEPTEFLVPDGFDAVLRPVDSKNVGAENENDPNFAYWAKIYKLAGVKNHSFVTTSIDKKKILSYWNAGHIAVKRESGILGKWHANFRQAMEHKLMPEHGIFYVEQSILAATISSLEGKVKDFSFTYNYPIHLQDRIPDPERKIGHIDELVSAHYHKIFEHQHAARILRSLVVPGNEKSQWLVRALVKEGLLAKDDIRVSYKRRNKVYRDFTAFFRFRLPLGSRQ